MESHPLRQLILNKFLCFQSAQNSKTAQTAKPRYTAGTRALFFSLILLALLLFAGAASAQEQHRTFRVPFHFVNGMILLDAKVNERPAILLLDTGSDATILSPQVSGLSTVKLRALTANKATGANGEYVKARVDLRLAERHWIDREILVMDLSDASKRLTTRIDGMLGEDILRTFSSVRIDYKNQILELEG